MLVAPLHTVTCGDAPLPEIPLAGVEHVSVPSAAIADAKVPPPHVLPPKLPMELVPVHRVRFGDVPEPVMVPPLPAAVIVQIPGAVHAHVVPAPQFRMGAKLSGEP